MVSPGTLTVCDQLLVAALSMGDQDGVSFTAEDLVVAAWRAFPLAFGLRGHNDDKNIPLFPDSNRVFAEIMGSKPIRSRGYLVKVGKKRYALTPLGRDAARRVVARTAGGSTGGGRASLERVNTEGLQRLLSSRAVERVLANEVERLTFNDACLFWGITPGSSAIQLEGALSRVDSLITAAETAIDSGAFELTTGKADLTVERVKLLQTVHDTLKSKFTADVALIMKRRDERRA